MRWRVFWRGPDLACWRFRWRICLKWSTSPTSPAPSTNIRTGGSGCRLRSMRLPRRSMLPRSRLRHRRGSAPRSDTLTFNGGSTLPSRIEDYGLIGDCETAALVGCDGSIDWLCWPAFDSDACFAALLGTAKNGRWLIAPAEAVTKTSRRYWDNTLILETRFETANGIVALIDFMPPRGKASDVVRLIRGVSGNVKLKMELVIRFDFGIDIPWVRRTEDGALLAIAGQDMTVLRTPVETRGEDLTTVAEFEVNEGAPIPFVLTYGPSHLPLPEPIDPAQALQDTEDYWTEWSNRCTYQGEHHGLVMRSLITLKALTYDPTGGIVAAPTTSLPEKLGGARNWDYRFCWLRDATFTLLALMNSGYTEEASAWHNWLLPAAAGWPANMQIMYGIIA